MGIGPKKEKNKKKKCGRIKKIAKFNLISLFFFNLFCFVIILNATSMFESLKNTFSASAKILVNSFALG